MRIKRNLTAAVLAGCMTLSFAAAVPHSSVMADDTASVDEVKQQQEQTREKKAEAKKKLDDLKAAKDDLVQTIANLDSQINDYQAKVDSLTAQRNDIQTKIAITENSLQDSYVAETNQYASMKERIQFAYENGDAEYLDALVSIQDYSSITNQSEYVSQVSVYDQHQLNDLAAIEQSIDSYQTDLKDSLKQIDTIKGQTESEQSALQVLQDGKQELLGNTEDNIDATSVSIEELEKLEAEQDSQISAIEAAAAARRAAAAAAATTVTAPTPVKKPAAVSTASPGNATAVNNQTQKNTAATANTPMNSYGGGGFIWPAPSTRTITSYYGSRTAPTEGATSNHKGIDIGCGYGSSVVAAASGVVAYTGYFGGGGNCVIIDHGNGLSTLYMHLSSFACSVGQNVNAGTVIAYSGSTGVSTGPHLHFAVRLNGSYVDPLGYL